MYRIIFLPIIIWTEIEAYGLMIDSVIAARLREKIYPLFLGLKDFFIS